ncbi:MAG: hypothetical protein M1838_002935 [Thelocarpon superellum]|nr:MAG: hypothetical protein M1838_002935 [Thelocarpon superellum]
MPIKSKKRVSEADELSAQDDVTINTAKKRKTSTTTKKGESGANKKNVPGGGALDDDGAPFWEISNQRRVTISEYKGNVMVNIREYYTKDNKSLPGKKGISMPVAQYTALVSLMPHIETVLKEKGVEELVRPVFGDDTPASKVEHEDEGEHEEEEDDEEEDSGEDAEGGRKVKEEVEAKKEKEGKEGKEKKSQRRNFEATSDEDEDE